MSQHSLVNQDSNDAMVQLRSVAYFFAVLYFFLTLAHFFFLQDDFKWVLITSALVTATVSFMLGRMAAHISSTQQSLGILALLVMGTSNSLLHLWLSHAPEQTTNIFVTIIASGIVLSNRYHWVAAILFNWLGWITVNFVLEMPLVQHFFFAMSMSTLLSWFAHLARKNVVAKQIELKQERDIAIQHEMEAKAATEAKSAFLANMSHEIRTPMNGVIGMIEMVARSNLNKDQADFIATAKRSADSLMIIINDILDFSKIEVGELAIELMEFDVDQFLSELVHDQQFQASKKGLLLDLSKPQSQQTRVVGDPYRIKQILNNLLSNAIKFTETGGINILYHLVHIDDYLRLDVEVRDTGMGISETALPFLFDSFSQADTSTTRRFGGTGLGLAICKQLCELMGGNISVESQIGKGSTFKFSIKLGVPAPLAPLSQQQHRASMPSFVHLRLLLVEDNFINQQVMLAILESIEVNVDVANDGLEAIDMLKQARPTTYDVILMDCQMPNLDGYEATRRIRAGDAGEVFSQIPIVALTANALTSEKQKCFDAGMNNYLTKPVEIESLKTILASYHKI
ncbi:ATP-binding protein [Flavobacterium sp. W21_SRS_FM6]|uniref:ATP-binding protein n=1 Tax=Flavobacterium sp. W21_SRS_FM6 TaxID=3240268 RepID=UPI003F8F71B2